MQGQFGANETSWYEQLSIAGFFFTTETRRHGERSILHHFLFVTMKECEIISK